jgi:hypothetical protein
VAARRRAAQPQGGLGPEQAAVLYEAMGLCRFNLVITYQAGAVGLK